MSVARLLCAIGLGFAAQATQALIIPVDYSWEVDAVTGDAAVAPGDTVTGSFYIDTERAPPPNRFLTGIEYFRDGGDSRFVTGFSPVFWASFDSVFVADDLRGRDVFSVADIEDLHPPVFAAGLSISAPDSVGFIAGVDGFRLEHLMSLGDLAGISGARYRGWMETESWSAEGTLFHRLSVGRNAVPEPGALALFIAGLLALALGQACSRRRSRD